MSIKTRHTVIVTLFAGMFGLCASSATAGPQNDKPDVGNRGSTCGDGAALSKRVDFASLSRARQILGHPDDWARQLSDFDMAVRQKTAQPTSLREFLSFTADSSLDWTLQEEAAWRPLIDILSQALKGLNLHLPNIDLIKTTGAEEFGSAYTRARAIMLPARAASLPLTDARRAYFLLAHELFHVLSRADSHLRDELYSLLGFKPLKGFEYPTELEGRRVSNPDAFEYLHMLTVQSGLAKVDVLPVIQSRLPLNEAIQLPNFFAALDIVLLSVDARTGEARRDSNGNLIRYNFGNTNWIPLVMRNSSYIIHPEELLADNFATLMEWRSERVLPASNPDGFPVNDTNLLVTIQDVLTSRCRN
jgi:hypothetical protein